MQRLEQLKEIVTSRIRFKIMDVTDAQAAGWHVRKAESGPSKISN
jgi:hypothetical protein